MSSGASRLPIILASNPPGLPSAGIAIAAARAGHVGLLDLELIDPAAPAAQREVTRLMGALSRGCAGQWGIKAELAALPALAGLLGPHRPDWIVVTEAVPAELAEIWPAFAARWPGCRLVIEVREATGIADKIAALAACGVHGFLAKGFEAGGPVATETTYMLIQWLRRLTDLPVFAQGGIAPDTAAAVMAAGASGILLDWQLALFDAAEMPARLMQAVSAMDGSETRCLGLDLGLGVRTYWRADHAPSRKLDALERELNASGQPQALARESFMAALRAAVAQGPADQALWLVGQDAAFAPQFRAGHSRLGAALDALQSATAGQVHLAASQNVLAKDAPMARAMGTRYPVVQGPMTRVSDRAEFALAVAKGGALPFLALALMRGAEAGILVTETKALLGDLSWGIGILGFVDDDLRAEQTQVILDHKPGFAVIAGGRPDQALALERAGVATYLHVPSPGLLKLFLESGTRRFIFEGHECGGHVGPRTSFVLWQQAVDVLMAAFAPGTPMDVEVWFAGGIHDAVSAAMVAALAARIVDRGAKVGVLVGTGYLFTAEAVAAGAIRQSYQDLLLQAQETVLLESGPGHMTRVADSPIVTEFRAEKARLQLEGLSGSDLRDRLEHFNIGRSRIASKGVDRNPARAANPDAPRFVDISPEDQLRLGVYMTGQAAGLHDRPTTISALHEDLCDGAVAWMAALVAQPAAVAVPEPAEGPGACIAITGISTILPKAVNSSQYWQNILDKVDAIEEVPARRWDWRRYYDADRHAPDKIYSKWGGFLNEMEFDPLRYGIPPTSLPQIEPLQLLALEAVRQALEDAGYPGGVIPDAALRKRTSVIIGVGGGAGPLGQKYAVRSALPAIEGRVSETAAARLPEWTEDSFPGVLLNVIAGRIANRFDLGGVNFTVDAACGSSLAAVMLAARELEAGTSDMVIVGGVDSFQNPFDFLAFSKTRALSPRGRCRTFDASADGIAISEGLALVVLRRLADAEAEGGRIYAVLRGVAGSSDGRDLSLTAPRAEGQQEALHRAYAQAGISPATVGMVEAHGTGTVVGDQTEIQSLSRVFADSRSDRQFCGVGSVKSMIGHTKAAAGCAGMIKMALALHHRVQPATLNVTVPNPNANFSESPFYVQTEARPWLRSGNSARRAGVSAFGFGGTNFHAVLEEYEGGYLDAHQEPFRLDWAEEVLAFSAANAADLAQALERAAAGIAAADPAIRLADIAASLAHRFDPSAGARAAVVAAIANRKDLIDRLSHLAAGLRSAPPAADGVPRRVDPRGSFLALGAALSPGQVALLFPGQGSQYPGMAASLAMHFPLVRQTLEETSQWLAGRTPQPLCDLIHPIPTLDPDVAAAQTALLTRTDVAQPAIGAVSLAVLRLLRSLGLQAGAFVGHSFGEYTALHAAGAFDATTLLDLAHARGDAIMQSVQGTAGDLGTMSAVGADAATVRAALGGDGSVVLANLNAPDQTVIAGPTSAVAAAGDRLRAAGLNVQPLPVACGFHSPCVAPARDRLAAALAAAQIGAPGLPVYANATAAPYSAQPEQVRGQLADHLISPVDFVASVQAMHAAGARLFLEVGPNGVLSRLVDRCLAGQDGVLALASDGKGKAGIGAFLGLLAGAAAAGLPLTLGALWSRRARTDLDVLTWDLARSLPKRPSVVWLIDAANVRPLGGEVNKLGFATPVEDDIVPAAVVLQPVSVASPVVQPVIAAPVAVVETAPGPGMADTAAAEFALRRHHELMTRFLDSSREVMLAYIGQGAVPAGRAAPSVVAALPAAQVMPPVAAPDPVTTLPAAPVLALPVAPTVPAPAQSVSLATVTDALRALIADRTGYPTDMLAADLDLEADLGVDSIKRVEIVGALRMQLLPQTAGTEAVREAMGPVARSRSIALIAAKFIEVAGGFAPAAAAAPTSQTPIATTAIAPPASVPALTLATVTDALRALIADRTGYPTDMLAADLDLEADLGVDSIKRVEIVGALRMQLLPQTAGTEAVREAMGPVARSRSIALIAAKFIEVAGGFAPAAAPAPAPTSQTPIAADKQTSPMKSAVSTRDVQHWNARFVMVPQTISDTGPATALPVGRYAITDDGTGLSQHLATALAAFGLRAEVLDAGLPDADLRRLVDMHRDWVGLFHLAPLGVFAMTRQGQPKDWHGDVTRATRALYTVLQAMGPGLVARRDGVVITASALGGAFGFDGSVPENPAAGGAPGLLKAVALEWTAVHCRAVDLAPGMAPDAQVQALLDEATYRTGPVEVGRAPGNRLELLAEPRSLAPDSPVTVGLNPGDVILVTGGARGITAKIALHLSQMVAAHFVLMGTQAVPDAPEPADIAGLAVASAVKAALIARAKAAGQAPRPAKIERQWREIQKIREIRETLSALRVAGAKADYIACNVRDRAGFAAAIGAIRDRLGRIDGVLHGAGVIEDKLLADKTLDSFEQVLRTKTDSAETLAQTMGLLPGLGAPAGGRPRFVVFFTSVAGRFGNRGQGDYGAANETVSKFARWLQAQPQAAATRICAVSWGPWDTGAGGMVSPEIKAQFDALGIVPIPPELGVAALAAELRHGSLDEPEVVWGEGPWARDAARMVTAGLIRAAE